jgi:hypothetical protein
MANITISDTTLEHLKCRASELAVAVDSLATIFEEGAICLKRKEETARLKGLCSSILERVKREREMEMAAEMGGTMADGLFSVVRLVAGLVTSTFEDSTMQAISRELLAQPGRRETHFRIVLVRVGPGGVPDDVDIVNISELARQSERGEQAVIDGLLAQGNLLLGERAFSRLMDRLADGILKGELGLPLVPQRFLELQEHRPLQLSSMKNDG